MRGALGLAVVILLGCSGKPAATTPSEGSAPAKPSPEFETQIEAMTKYQDQMCACADKACVDKVAGDMATWSEQQAKKYAGHEPVPSEDQKTRMTAISEKLGGCMNQLSASPPPAE
jgi:hypothetical protein